MQKILLLLFLLTPVFSDAQTIAHNERVDTRIIFKDSASSSPIYNSALIVVDGVIWSSADRPNFLANAISSGSHPHDIDPNKIESITVLDGSSALALYGSRGAKGVIVITTKKDK